MRFQALSVLSFMAVVSALVGCGSSGGSTSTATVTVERSREVSQAEFLAQADAICREENKVIAPKSEALEEEFNNASTRDEVKQAAEDTRVLAAEVQAGLSRIRDLDPPAAQRSAIETMLALADTQVTSAEALADAAEAEDKPKIEAIEEQATLDTQRYKGLTQGLGFQHCGHSGG